jgi:NAD(P)-dependent dehydrogenase (short-subunit alcohol dehydrogenase family)
MLSSAPKAAVWMMVRHAAAEEAKNGIRVNAVGPGVIGDVGMAVAMSDNTGREQDSFNRSVSKIPMGRMGKAQELAEVITFLASNNASYVTGVLVPCDGGLALS